MTSKRIRVTEHPLQIHLLFAVWAHLLLSNDAPASYAELVEPGFGVKAQHGRTGQQLNTLTGKIELKQMCQHLVEKNKASKRRSHLNQSYT